METTIYHYALCVSLTLMLFFSYRFVFGRLPDSELYRPYRQSRRLMGVALLELSANYMVHFFVTPRALCPAIAILMNLCTYWLSVWLFGSAMMLLLDREWVSRRRFIRHIVSWVAYCLITLVLWFLLPSRVSLTALPIVLAIVFMAYAVRVSRKVFLTFRRTIRRLDDYYSDDGAAYIRWMSVFTYWAVFFGAGQGVFTFVPDRYVYVWIISAIPFYIYLYESYSNYLLLYEKAADILDKSNDADAADEEQQTAQNPSQSVADNVTDEQNARPQLVMSHDQEAALERGIKEWIDKEGYTVGGLNIADVARATATNRTYLSAYINTHYQMTFREWVNMLRLDYAKRLMIDNPELPVTEVARLAGYLSLSYFTKTFKDAEGVTPGKWCR